MKNIAFAYLGLSFATSYSKVLTGNVCYSLTVVFVFTLIHIIQEPVSEMHGMTLSWV